MSEEVSKQSDYTKRHNKMSYGKKGLSFRIRQEDRKSREEDKMDDDGSGTFSTGSADFSLGLTKIKSESLDNKRGPCTLEFLADMVVNS